MPNKFWKFQNAADGSGDAELLLYGDIASKQSWFGDEVTPKQFAEELNALGAVGAVRVLINSGGGDVFAAQAIGNLLEQHKATVTARIDGVCASAATIIACHCDKVVAANDSTYMVHPIKMGICGYADAATLQQYIDALNTLRENVVALYAKKTCRDKDEVAAWMDATSWWTGPQAKENGFVDELTDEGAAPKYENRGGLLFVNSVATGLPFDKAPKTVQDSAGKPGAAVDLTSPAQARETKPAGKPGEHKEAQEMDPKNEIKTVDDLRAAYPALVDQIEQAAADKATTAERERIQGIENGTLKGGEALAAEAKFTKPISVDQFNAAMLQNVKDQGATYLDQVKKDAQEGGVNGVQSTPPADQNAGDDFLATIKGLAPKN